MPGAATTATSVQSVRGSGYIDQAIAGSANSFINSLAFGGHFLSSPSQNSSAFSSLICKA